MKAITVAPIDGIKIGKQFDFSPILGEVLDLIPENGCLEFLPGEYHFWPEAARKSELYISNTDSAEYPEKNIALLLIRKKNIIIKGDRAKLYFHGNIVALALLECENVCIEGLELIYPCPPCIDARVVSHSDCGGRSQAKISFPKEVFCEVEKGIVYWQGEKSPYTGKAYWKGRNGLDLSQHRRGNAVKRVENDLFDQADQVCLSDGALHIEYTSERDIAEGDGFQMRLTRRDAAGIFLSQSQNISFSHLHIGYLYGMGVVSQLCTNLSFSSVRFEPTDGNRQSSSAADTLHFSSCGGKIEIYNCEFSNPHDDSINIHGTYLKVESMDEKTLILRYCHLQTQGFLPFFSGDLLQFTDGQSLLPMGEKRVISSAKFIESANKTQVQIALKKKPDIRFSANLVVDNQSYQPDVRIQHNRFQSIPTRGILIGSAGKVEIKNNQFFDIEMAAIYISADAEEWYESGAVKDLLIEDNEFMCCRKEIICIDPHTRMFSKEKIHNNITIRKNKMNAEHFPAIAIRSAGNVKIIQNKVNCFGGNEKSEIFLMNYDSHVICQENEFYDDYKSTNEIMV